LIKRSLDADCADDADTLGINYADGADFNHEGHEGRGKNEPSEGGFRYAQHPIANKEQGTRNKEHSIKEADEVGGIYKRSLNAVPKA
jgi:hypothetical protein